MQRTHKNTPLCTRTQFSHPQQKEHNDACESQGSIPQPCVWNVIPHLVYCVKEAICLKLESQQTFQLGAGNNDWCSRCKTYSHWNWDEIHQHPCRKEDRKTLLMDMKKNNVMTNLCIKETYCHQNKQINNLYILNTVKSIYFDIRHFTKSNLFCLNFKTVKMHNWTVYIIFNYWRFINAV